MLAVLLGAHNSGTEGKECAIALQEKREENSQYQDTICSEAEEGQTSQPSEERPPGYFLSR